MATDLVSRVMNDPNFIELEKKRNGLGVTLAVTMLVIYYGYIALLAFAKPFLSTIIGGGGVVTYAFPIGLFVLVSAIVITGIYVWRANTEFDGLTRKIMENNQ